MIKVNVEVVQRPVIFPSVTICHKNHLDSLVIEELEGMFDLEGTVSTSTKLNDHLDKFKRSYINFSDNLTAFLKHFDNLSMTRYNDEIPEVRNRFRLST